MLIVSNLCLIIHPVHILLASFYRVRVCKFRDKRCEQIIQMYLLFLCFGL